jgi:hypothetical protein
VFDPVVDTPPDVVGTRAPTVAPPRVGVSLIRVEVAEGINEPSINQFGETGSFFVGKSSALMVGLGASKIDFLVRNI